MSSRLVAVAFVTVAASSLAQTAATDSFDLSRGVTLLPGSAAFADEATALVYNPAGLSRAGALNAWYVHERSNARGLDNDGVYLASSIGNVVGLGFGVESLRPVAGAHRSKTMLGMSFGGEGLSLGVNLNWFNGAPAGRVTTADLGLQSRLTRWLSLGGFARNLNAPTANGVTFGREWNLAIGLRPLGERVSVGIDWFVNESLPASRSRMQYTVNASLVRGLNVMLGVSHGFSGADPLFLQAGLGVDFENIGYTQGVAFAENQVNWQFAVRASVDKHPTIVPQKKLAVISLGDLSDGGTTLGSLIGIGGEDKFLKLLRLLERAAADKELEGIVLKVEGAGLGLARSDELRSAIVRLRGAGKKVFAYVLSATDADYLAISACDAIYAAPEAMMLVDGLRSSVLFFGGTAQKVGIHVDVARVGKYKNAPDQLTRSDMSPEQREAIEAYLDSSVKTIASRIEASRPKLTPEKWQAAVDEGLKATKRAKELGQIDDVLTPQQLDELLKGALPNARLVKDYQPFDTRDPRWDTKREIAIIPVLGNITGGKSSPSPLGGDVTAGAESFIQAISAAADDGDVAAIVVRVDSPGGDGLASDLMYRAVLEARKKKPVIASMGDTAASGGYYVAMGAEEIFASPTTLTGSIGVFFVKPAVKKLAEDWGAAQVSINRGKYAGITDVFEPWTEEQRAVAQKWVDDFYDSFITEVSSSRGMSKDMVDAVARGRVWSGEDAKARGLVNHLGGLMDAIAAARVKAGLEPNEEVELTIRSGRGGGLLSMLGSTLAPKSLLESAVPTASPLPPIAQSLAKQLGAAAWILEPRVQARLEYSVEIK